jgi:predicted transcriptional regulator
VSVEVPATLTLDTPEQLRAIADPLRQRLLQTFARSCSIKEAAKELGEPVTKLYHHVDQLLAAGLIRVAGEERRRAVVERHFQVAAHRFVVSPASFDPGAGREAERARIARSSVEDMLAASSGEEGAFRMVRGSRRLSASALERLEVELMRLMVQLEEPDAPLVDVMLLATRRL